MRISDWSSDVCSSDLISGTRVDLSGATVRARGGNGGSGTTGAGGGGAGGLVEVVAPIQRGVSPDVGAGPSGDTTPATNRSQQNSETHHGSRNAKPQRSDERRGGKEGVRECRSRWGPDD